MKTLKRITALTIVAGGFLVAGMTSSADAGDCGGFGIGAYGYGYGFGINRPIVVAHPHVNLLFDAYGHNYFIDGFGIRHNCFQMAYGNQFFYLNHGVRQFVLAY